MARRKRSLQTSQTHRPWPGRRFVVCVFGIAAIVVVLIIGPRLVARWARHMASREMDAWAPSAAQEWLATAAWLDSGNGTTDFMQAVCYRRLDQMAYWNEALQSAERKGLPSSQIRRETTLGFVRTGQFDKVGELRPEDLIETGASMHDVAASFVHGYLLKGERDKARTLLERWEAIYPNEAHVAYMRGMYQYELGETLQAIVEFEDALARQPGHELARRAVAELSETGDRLDHAYGHYAELSARSPANAAAQVGLARVLRKLGRVNAARDMLGSLNSQPEPPADVAMEMGQIEFESGNYEEAERWYARTDLEQVEDIESLSAAATAFAFRENPIRAERLFTRSAISTSKSRRMYDLGVRLVIDPNDKQAADELQQLSEPSSAVSVDAGGNTTESPANESAGSPAASGPDLYALNCSACHGVSGGGDGRAAWHLFPRPRDFRTERFRLVSTLNGAPTLGDLEAVTKRGMPGTSMPAFEDLSDEQHRLVAQEVLRLHREGVRSRFIEMLRDEGEEIDEDDVRHVVENRTAPGEVTKVPQIGPPGSQAVANGKETYHELGCNKCHGDEGIGDGETPSFDDKGRPIRPRDLAHEPFKGGQEPESIYVRIALGMPGTPHPSSPTLAEVDLIDLVHFCRSLSQEPKRTLTNHQRAVLSSGRAYLLAFGE